MSFSFCSREAYVLPSTRESRLGVWLGKLDGLRGRKPLAPLTSPVLVLVDLQALFLDPSSRAYLPAWPAAVEPCAALLNAFRQRNLPVIWTRQVSDLSATEADELFGRPLRDDDPLSRLAAGCVPREGEPVLCKSQYSAWSCPEFASRLRPESSIVLAGVTTNRCILATAMETASRGRACIVAADACSSTNEAMHESALAVLAAGFASVAATSEILRVIEEGATP